MSNCDISAKILSDYDEKLAEMAQLAFDMFDAKNDNTIDSSELERVMCSLGHEVDYLELDDFSMRSTSGRGLSSATPS